MRKLTTEQIADILMKLENSPVYHAGDLAYISACSGMIPCVVQSVEEPGNGIFAGAGRITVEVTADHGAYILGEIVENLNAINVIPRGHRKIHHSEYEIDQYYLWR